MRRLLVTPSRCTGCRTCEIACAFSHPVDGEPGRSTIRALPAGKPETGTPVVCLQCDSAACVAVCPARALWRDMKTGAVIVKRDRCISCHTCVYACPFGNISVEHGSARITKCDLCGGNPRCAQFCPTRTLEYVARRPSHSLHPPSRRTIDWLEEPPAGPTEHLVSATVSPRGGGSTLSPMKTKRLPIL